MERAGTDAAGDTLTAYDFAMEEVIAASSKLARALESGDGPTTTKECSYAWSVYEKMIDLYPQVRFDTTQRASFLKELRLLRSRLEACEADA